MGLQPIAPASLEAFMICLTNSLPPSVSHAQSIQTQEKPSLRVSPNDSFRTFPSTMHNCWKETAIDFKFFPENEIILVSRYCTTQER